MKKPLVQTAPLKTRIDVTPVIDVALVLVIILLITAPMMSVADLDLELPMAHSRDQEEPSHLTITIDRDGVVAVEDLILGSINAIPDELHSRLEGKDDQERLVVIRADAALSHALVRRVMDKVRAGGAMRLGLATQQGRDI